MSAHDEREGGHDQRKRPANGDVTSRIREVECLIVDRAYPFVIVQTEDGLIGVGECFRRSPRVVKAAVDTVLRPLIIGKNALDIGSLWDQMLEACRWSGPVGSLLPAVAGVDIALWDILGKSLNAPIHRLLGGKRRDRIRFYASSLRRDLSVEEEVRRAADLVEQGWAAYKFHGALTADIDDPADHTVAKAAALRAALGDKVDIMVDVNGAYSRHRALLVGLELERLGVFHFEEPVNADDLDGLAHVADRLAMPIAAGEMCHTHQQFHELAQRGRVDILQPDIVKVGGFTELARIETIASTFNLPITVHNTQPTISTVAHLHFCAASASTPYAQEYNVDPVPIRDEHQILMTALQIEPGGFIRVPDGPGLGIEVDLPLMRRLAAE